MERVKENLITKNKPFFPTTLAGPRCCCCIYQCRVCEPTAVALMQEGQLQGREYIGRASTHPSLGGGDGHDRRRLFGLFADAQSAAAMACEFNSCFWARASGRWTLPIIYYSSFCGTDRPTEPKQQKNLLWLLALGRLEIFHVRFQFIIQGGEREEWHCNDRLHRLVRSPS